MERFTSVYEDPLFPLNSAHNFDNFDNFDIRVHVLRSLNSSARRKKWTPSIQCLIREFSKDSVPLVKRCHKPDHKEFTKVVLRTAIRFVVMGVVRFFVKLIFIPINNIIVGVA